MKHHTLKTDPLPFDAVWRGDKTYEIRYNDRDFQTGDTLTLVETVKAAEVDRGVKTGFITPANEGYTGRKIQTRISHVQTGYGLCAGWAILSLAPHGMVKIDDNNNASED